jgi:DNA-binding transcriptional ArsR family regulator
MPARIKLAKQRLVMAKMVMSMLRAVTTAYMDTQQYGSAADDALLLFAVYIGQAERRPMTANKLAAYVGMPRATVTRKLRALQAAGMVELDENGGACCVIDRLNKPDMVASIEASMQAVHRTAAELSKMDGKPIAAS